MANIIVSIVIPTYMPGSYLFKSIERLAHQTLSVENFEVILVLNGEKEPYYSQLENCISSYSGVLNIRLEYLSVCGVSQARNHGLHLACGEYISFMDDDDYVTDNYLENLLKLASPYRVVASNVIAVDEMTGKEIDHYFLAKAYQKVAGKEHPSLFTARSFLSSVCCKLIPKSVIGDTLFPTDFSLGEDALFMFAISPNIQQLEFAAADTIYYVRYRPVSASHRYYSYWFRLGLAIRTTYRYFLLYMRKPFSYNFLLFISRIIATLRKLTQSAYELQIASVNVD